MIYYNVTMGRFLLEIRVFNINEKNFEGPYKIIGSGAFGAIIKKEMKNMKSVAKVQNFDNYEANAEDIYFFIKEVCFYKIMSLFHAGPRFFTELDCDLICYDQTAQFHLEQCLSIKHKQFYEFSKIQNLYQLHQSVKIMHQLNITHNDLKPGNVLWSISFKRFVVTDFGISQVNRQNIGERSFVNYQGTEGYLLEQMMKIKNTGRKGYVDLRKNDLFGLKKSVNEIKARSEQLNQQSQDSLSNSKKFNQTIYLSQGSANGNQFKNDSLPQTELTSYSETNNHLQYINILFSVYGNCQHLQVRKYWTCLNEKQQTQIINYLSLRSPKKTISKFVEEVKQIGIDQKYLDILQRKIANFQYPQSYKILYQNIKQSNMKRIIQQKRLEKYFGKQFHQISKTNQISLQQTNPKTLEIVKIALRSPENLSGPSLPIYLKNQILLFITSSTKLGQNFKRILVSDILNLNQVSDEHYIKYLKRVFSGQEINLLKIKEGSISNIIRKIFLVLKIQQEMFRSRNHLNYVKQLEFFETLINELEQNYPKQRLQICCLNLLLLNNFKNILPVSKCFEISSKYLKYIQTLPLNISFIICKENLLVEKFLALYQLNQQSSQVAEKQMNEFLDRHSIFIPSPHKFRQAEVKLLLKNKRIIDEDEIKNYCQDNQQLDPNMVSAKIYLNNCQLFESFHRLTQAKMQLKKGFQKLKQKSSINKFNQQLNILMIRLKTQEGFIFYNENSFQCAKKSLSEAESMLKQFNFDNHHDEISRVFYHKSIVLNGKMEYQKAQTAALKSLLHKKLYNDLQIKNIRLIKIQLATSYFYQNKINKFLELIVEIYADKSVVQQANQTLLIQILQTNLAAFSSGIIQQSGSHSIKVIQSIKQRNLAVYSDELLKILLQNIKIIGFLVLPMNIEEKQEEFFTQSQLITLPQMLKKVNEMIQNFCFSQLQKFIKKIPKQIFEAQKFICWSPIQFQRQFSQKQITQTLKALFFFDIQFRQQISSFCFYLLEYGVYLDQNNPIIHESPAQISLSLNPDEFHSYIVHFLKSSRGLSKAKHISCAKGKSEMAFCFRNKHSVKEKLFQEAKLRMESAVHWIHLEEWSLADKQLSKLDLNDLVNEIGQEATAKLFEAWEKVNEIIKLKKVRTK